jgi:hypothetical protein
MVSKLASVELAVFPDPPSREAPVVADNDRGLLRDNLPPMDITVELIGDEIVVTKPRTTFLLAYRKSIEEPRLVMTGSSMGKASPSAMHSFRAQAFQAANAKARELRWIV